MEKLESEAKTKWCPRCPRGNNCIGSDCNWWIKAERNPAMGYCGALGVWEAE